MRAVKPYIISKTILRKRNLRILCVSIGVIILSGGVIGYFYIKDLFKNKDTSIGVSQSYPQQQKASPPSSQSSQLETANEESKPPLISDTTPPIVVSTIPESGATSVEVDKPITVTFSEAIDTSTINAHTFTVEKGSGSIDGIASCSNDGVTASFVPSSKLFLSSTRYTVTIKGIKDLAGNAIAFNFVWSFTTVSVPTASKPPAVASKPKEEGSQQTSMLTSIYLSGEWDVKLDRNPAKLSITQSGNSLSGSIMYGNVKEYLSGEINNGQIVLRGTGYFEAIASSNLSPHIFYGSITNYGNTITGKYYDTGGNENNWYATKLQRSSPLHLQE